MDKGFHDETTVGEDIDIVPVTGEAAKSSTTTIIDTSASTSSGARHVPEQLQTDEEVAAAAAEANKVAEAAKRQREEDELQQKQREEARRKQQAEAAKQKQKEQEAQRKRQADEAKKKQEAEEAKRKQQAEAAKQKQMDEDAKRKKKEEDAKQKQKEEEAKRKRHEAEAKRKRNEDEAKSKEKEERERKGGKKTAEKSKKKTTGSKKGPLSSATVASSPETAIVITDSDEGQQSSGTLLNTPRRDRKGTKSRATLSPKSKLPDDEEAYEAMVRQKKNTSEGWEEKEVASQANQELIDSINKYLNKNKEIDFIDKVSLSATIKLLEGQISGEERLLKLEAKVLAIDQAQDFDLKNRLASAKAANNQARTTKVSVCEQF